MMLQGQQNQTEVLDKTITLLASADPLAYQAIQTMHSSTKPVEESYVPTELEEALHEVERSDESLWSGDIVEDFAFDADEIRDLLRRSDGVESG
jgi:hypothetical protein